MSDTGRMPAQIMQPLRGDDYLCSPYIQNEVIVGNDSINCQQVTRSGKKWAPGSGNKCGHDRKKFKKPKFFGRNDKLRTHLQEEAKRRILASQKNIYLYPKFAALFYHPLKNGKGRRRRSEAQEASIYLALLTLVHGLHLNNMCYGHYDSGNKFHYYGYGKIRKETDLSVVRLSRNTKILKDHGLITVNVIVDDQKKTEKVIIRMTDKLFAMLELDDKLLEWRQMVSIKWQEKQKRLEKNRGKLELYRPKMCNKPRGSAINVQNKTNIAKELADKMTPKLENNYRNDRRIVSLASELFRSGECKTMDEAFKKARAKEEAHQETSKKLSNLLRH